MSNAVYQSGTVSVTTTAAILVVTLNQNNWPTLVQNRGPVTVYLGGASVTADAASTGGFALAPGQYVPVPSGNIGGTGTDLYAVTAAGTADVSYLAPNIGSGT